MSKSAVKHKVKQTKAEWHSPQCKRRSEGRFAGCWCALIPAKQRKALDEEAAR